MRRLWRRLVCLIRGHRDGFIFWPSLEFGGWACLRCNRVEYCRCRDCNEQWERIGGMPK